MSATRYLFLVFSAVLLTAEPRTSLAGTLVDCTPDQSSTLQAIESDSSNRIDRLLTEWGNANEAMSLYGSPRFDQWFGTRTVNRDARVRHVFERAKESAEQSSLKLHCTCTARQDERFVAVVPVGRTEVRFCSRFWSYDSTTQSGIFLHELTHLNSVTSTVDHAYGQFAVAELARQQPQSALMNAASYELFFTNIQNLPLAGTPGDQHSPLAVTRTSGASELFGELSKQQIGLYRTSGSTQVELRSDNGADVDLYVWDESNQLPVQTCVSNQRATVKDQCTLDPQQIYTIEVRPYRNDPESIFQYTLITAATAAGSSTADTEESGSGSIGIIMLAILAALLHLLNSYRKPLNLVSHLNK